MKRLTTTASAASILLLTATAVPQVAFTPSAAASTPVVYSSVGRSGRFLGPHSGAKTVTHKTHVTYRHITRPVHVHWSVRASTNGPGYYRTTCTVRLIVQNAFGQLRYQLVHAVDTPKLAGAVNVPARVSRTAHGDIYRARFPIGSYIHAENSDHMYPEHVPGEQGGGWFSGPNTYIISGFTATNDCITSVTVDLR